MFPAFKNSCILHLILNRYWAYWTHPTANFSHSQITLTYIDICSIIKRFYKSSSKGIVIRILLIQQYIRIIWGLKFQFGTYIIVYRFDNLIKFHSWLLYMKAKMFYSFISMNRIIMTS